MVAGCQAELQRLLRLNLQAGRYDVTAARTGREALALAARRMPEAVILDLSLPEVVGTDVIGQLRRWYQPPIIALSGRTSPDDRIGALDAGADHYLTKPFSMDELMARLRAALRRDRGAVIHSQSQVIIGRWHIDLMARRITQARAAAPATAPPAAPPETAERIRLTPTEWAILEVLLRNPRRLVTRQALLTQVWGPQYTNDTGYLRLYLAQLRKKLEPVPSTPRYLLTEAGMGYRFSPDPDAPAEWTLVHRNGRRVPVALTHEAALDYARAAARRFGVGSDRRAVFGK